MLHLKKIIIGYGDDIGEVENLNFQLIFLGNVIIILFYYSANIILCFIWRKYE